MPHRKSFKHIAAVVGGVIIIVIVALGARYGLSGRMAAPDHSIYVVQHADLTEAVQATGQVTATQNVDLAFQGSGRLARVAAGVGDRVRTGQVLAALDSSDLSVSLRTAQTNVESAKVALAQLMKPAENLTQLQAQDALEQAQQAQRKTEADLRQANLDAFTATGNAFVDLPVVMSDLHTVLQMDTLAPDQQANIDYYANAVSSYDPQVSRYRDDAARAYASAQSSYDQTFAKYKVVSRTADPAQYEALLNATYAADTAIDTAVDSASNLLNTYDHLLVSNDRAVPALVKSYEATLNVDAGKTSAHQAKLYAAQQALKNLRDALVNANQAVSERQAAVDKIASGAEPLDIQAQQLRIRQAEDAVAAVQTQIAKTVITAPFDGIITRQDGKVGQTVIPGVPLISLIADGRYQAETYVSEADVAKIAAGKPAQITLDAYGNAAPFAAHVVAVDPAATVQNGVNVYKVTLQFDGADDRIKEGMTANISVQAAFRQDVVAVPARAIITSGSDHFVLVVGANPQPVQRMIETGITGIDGLVEVTTGLSAGDKIVPFGGASQ
ncbi:MAG: efflux RND transporter periplasmic adaptor subunit [Patescibacteria group bacterium]|nr:efflux RND transporter periplasmic adaptor subunit [Patescibacteria group bacterium]